MEIHRPGNHSIHSSISTSASGPVEQHTSPRVEKSSAAWRQLPPLQSPSTPSAGHPQDPTARSISGGGSTGRTLPRLGEAMFNGAAAGGGGNPPTANGGYEQGFSMGYGDGSWPPANLQDPYANTQPWYIPTPAGGPSTEFGAGAQGMGGQMGSPYGGGFGTHRGAPPSMFATPEQGDSGPSSTGKDKSTPGGASGPKKRRKKNSTLAGNEDSISPAGDDKEKRTKTGRACDACRSKKIRCDILPTSEAPNEEQPICAHCKQYNLECTFFLPITETRFKRRKQEEGDTSLNTSFTQADSVAAIPSKPMEVPSRFEGPSSINFLLHTTLPASTSEAFDVRHHHSWEVSEDGNGLIRVNAPPSASGYADADPEDPTKAHNRLNKPVLSAQTISLLVNAYFDHLAHLFPIISRAEFAAKQSPSPLLLYSICGVGATRRQFPREVFAGVRGVINGLLRSNDILSDARFEHVQALLLLAQVGDLHAQPTAATASASLIRMGAATRMAQDLGLHRESNLRAQTPQDLAYVEIRRRVWATCVILDRWYGAALGIPLLIDLLDCDVLLPASYEILPEQDPTTWPMDPSFLALCEHLKLSILMGRILKTIYSPTGLKHATDAQLDALLADMYAWKAALPEVLQFKGPDSSVMAGLLHLSYAALHFLLWRVFMRITYILPPHLKFHISPPRWSAMQDWSQEGIEWLARHDEALDTLFVFPYAAVSCALVQYHSWARRRETRALETLKLVRETALRWETAVQPDQMSIRRKTCETMTLLYEAALKTDESSSRPAAINPTPGVSIKPVLGKAIWVRDDTRAGGGVWIAQSEKEIEESGLRKGTVILASDWEKEKVASAPAGTAVAGPSSQGQMPAGDGSAGDFGGPGGDQDPQTVLLQGMQMAASNVNPQLNFGQDANGNVVQGLDFHDVRNSDNNFDLNLLDGLPASGFNFEQWNSWFESIDRLVPPPDAQGNANISSVVFPGAEANGGGGGGA